MLIKTIETTVREGRNFFLSFFFLGLKIGETMELPPRGVPYVA